MNDFLARPWLLLAAPLIYWVLNEILRPTFQSGWLDILPAALAERLLTKTEAASNKPALIKRTWVLSLLTILFTLALAGVGYVLKADQLPDEQQELVIIQYLSPPVRGSALAQQQLATSQRVLIPLLNARKQGKTALIYYAATAHLVSPMTDDTNTLRQLLSLTHPSVMPLGGHQPQAAFRLAASLGKLANKAKQGRLDWLWLTDQLPDKAATEQLLKIKPPDANLYLIWLTASPSDVNKIQAAFADLNIYLLHPDQLVSNFHLLNRVAGSLNEENQQGVSFFQELSHWPLLAALLLLLWQYFEQPRFKIPFKASFLLFIFLVGIICQQPLQAAGWQNSDYQAWQAIKAGKANLAQKLAHRTDLKAHAEFLSGNYVEAAELFTQWQIENPAADKHHQAEILFNRGTARLLANQPEAALKDFEQAKVLQSDWPELCFNRELAKILLTNQPAPTEQSLMKACAAARKLPAPYKSEAAVSKEQEKEQDWQPEENSACVACQPLNAIQEKQLQQLQEDPWRLLKYRFKSELREQRP